MVLDTKNASPPVKRHIVHPKNESLPHDFATTLNEKHDSPTRLNNNNNNNRNSYNDNSVNLRTNFLSTNEVKFCDISDDENNSINWSSEKQRRKPTTSNNDTDSDSIMSAVPIEPLVKYPMPDGGYGWVVVFASVIVSMIADGISFSFGLLYTEFLVYFGESESKTSWIGSIFLAVPLLSGPIMSNLVDRYGCRNMTLIGGCITGTGFVLASMSSSVESLYYTLGFIGGLGLGISYVTAVVSIAFWFEKRRTLATSIGASGTGIGTFVYAPFTQFLIENLGWRGTCLILAGTLYNICVMGALMRDPDWLVYSNRLEQQSRQQSRTQSMATFSNSSVALDEIKKLLETGAPNEVVLDKLVTNVNTEANQQIAAEPMGGKRYQSLLNLPTFISSQELDSGDNVQRYGSRRSLRKKNQEDNNMIVINGLLDIKLPAIPPNMQKDENRNRLLASTETLNDSEKISYYDEDKQMSTPNDNHLEWRYNQEDDENNYENEADAHHTLLRSNSNDRSNNDIVIAVPVLVKNDSVKNKHNTKNEQSDDRVVMRRQPTLRNTHYLKNMRVHRNSIHYRGAMLNTHRYRLRASSCPNIYRNSMTTLAQEEEEKWYGSFIDTMKSIFDFSLFLDAKFFTFSMSTLLLFTWFVVPYFYLNEYMTNEIGYSEDKSASLISLIGVFSTIGMISLGIVGDQPWLNVPKAYAICLIICGLSCGLIPVFVTNLMLLRGLCIIFGLTFASSFSFTPILLVSLVSIEEFTCAYGLVLLVQGIGNLIGPPIAGVTKELTGSWEVSFYLAGIFIVISGMFVYMTAFLQSLDAKKEQKTVDTVKA